jgi:hypothetical protein
MSEIAVDVLTTSVGTETPVGNHNASCPPSHACLPAETQALCARGTVSGQCGPTGGHVCCRVEELEKCGAGRNDTVCVMSEEAALVCRDGSVDATKKCPGTSGMVCCTLTDDVLSARSGLANAAKPTVSFDDADLIN